MPDSYSTNTVFRPSELMTFNDKAPFVKWKGNSPFVNPTTGKRNGDWHYRTGDRANQFGRDIRESMLIPFGNQVRSVMANPTKATIAGTASGALLGAIYGMLKKDKSTLGPAAMGALLGGGSMAGLKYYQHQKDKK